MKQFATVVCSAALFFSAVQPVLASAVHWTDWVSSANSYSANGAIVVGATSVGVAYSATSPYGFVQTGVGTDFWSGAAYTSGTISNAPPAAELIALNQGGVVTITFSQSVKDPLIAINSWNSNTVDFGVPISFDSYGAGYWGAGYPILNGAGTGFFGVGELHGVVALQGNYNSVSFAHTSENWHGFTVGVRDVAAVPEAETYAMLLAGLGLIGFAARRRKA